MNQLNRTKAYLAAAAVLAAATFGLAGCGSHPAPKNENAGGEFLTPEEGSDVSRLADTQISAGSRTDSTLRAYHFRHGSLNSLGRQKLDRMIAANESDAADAGGDDDEAMVVYLDASTGTDDAANRLGTARQDAITDYLMSRGLTEKTFRIEMGHNPHDTFLATSALGSSSATAAAGAPAPAGTPAPAPATGGITK